MPENADRTIRRAGPENAARLSDLACRSKAYWGYSQDFTEACRDELTLSEEYVRTTPTYTALSDAALAGDEIVGFYSLDRLSADEVDLGYLFVEPAAIGTGYGRRLIEHAKTEARRMGFATMVIAGDPNAERFYLAAGGRLIGETPSESISGRLLPLFHIDL